MLLAVCVSCKSEGGVEEHGLGREEGEEAEGKKRKREGVPGRKVCSSVVCASMIRWWRRS